MRILLLLLIFITSSCQIFQPKWKRPYLKKWKEDRLKYSVLKKNHTINSVESKRIVAIFPNTKLYSKKQYLKTLRIYSKQILTFRAIEDPLAYALQISSYPNIYLPLSYYIRRIRSSDQLYTFYTNNLNSFYNEGEYKPGIISSHKRLYLNDQEYQLFNKNFEKIREELVRTTTDEITDEECLNAIYHIWPKYNNTRFLQADQFLSKSHLTGSRESKFNFDTFKTNFSNLIKLSLSSTPPGASIKVDGVTYNSSTNTILFLGFGNHQIQLVRPGYLPINIPIDVNSTESRVLNFDLKEVSESNPHLLSHPAPKKTDSNIVPNKLMIKPSSKN